MFGFLSKKRGLGIEVTEHYIRFVELEKTGDFLSLRRFGRLGIPTDTFSDQGLEKPEVLTSLLREILDDSQVKIVRLVLPSDSQKFFSLLIPKSSSREIIEHVVHGLKENVSYQEGKDSIADIHVLATEDGISNVRAVTTSQDFKKRFTPIFSLFEKYETHLERANQAALVGYNGDVEKPMLHVQFGDDFTSISIIDEGKVIDYQEIPFATYRFLREVQGKMTKPSHTASNYLSTLGVYGASVREFSEGAIKPLGVVIDHVLVQYGKQTGKTIKKITLGGAFAGFRGVPQMVSKYSRVEAVPAFPWQPFDGRFDETAYNMKKSETLEYLVSLGLTIECMY